MNRPCALLRSSVLALAACGLCALDANAQVAPPPGKALVVLYRVDKQPVAAKVPVIANAERLGDMGNGEFVNAIVNPGRTYLRVGDRILTTLALQTSPNQTYYVLVEAVPGLTPVRVELREMPEANARRAIAQSSPIATAPAAAAVTRAPAVVAAPALIAPAMRAPAAAPAPSAPPRPAAPAPRTASAPPKPAPPPPRRRAPPPEPEDEWQVALIAKAGSFKLASPEQAFGPLGTTYDATSKPAGGLELEFRHHGGFAVGGEVLYYKNDFTANAGAFHGDQAVIASMLNGKYYFGVADWLHPFVGAGVGDPAASFGKDFAGKSGGPAFQGMAGLDIRFSNVGLYLEYKYLSSTTEDSSAQKIKVGGKGVFAGLSIAF
jgi:opacity protein-like surface antigen